MFARSAPLALAVLLGSCAPRASAPVTPAPAPAPRASAPASSAEVALDYGQLVRLAAAREGTASARDCLLERDGSGLRFVGASDPALRPLPPASQDLDAALAHSVTINVLTPFGRHGAAPEALSLASFTYAPPTREAIALIVTDHGIALRGSDARVPARDQLSVEAAAEAAVALSSATLFVSAEAALPTRALVELLLALAAQKVPAALAAPLAPGTRLPAPRQEPRADLCADGLPETADPEGELAAQALAPAISALRTRAASCLTHAGPLAASGGKLALLLRIGPDGALVEACIERDEIGDAALRACILQEARKLSFPAPTRRGSVDLALPLALRPEYAPALPLLCAEPAAAR